MTWLNPPPLKSDPPKKGKKLMPEQLAGDSEHSQQVALFAWAADNVGKYPALKYMFAIPNGFYGSAEQKGKMKAEGLRIGVPDVFLPVAMHSGGPLNFKQYHGLFIEMKVEKYRNHKDGGCSDEQIEFINYATNVGYYCKVCYSWEEARDKIIEYLS